MPYVWEQEAKDDFLNEGFRRPQETTPERAQQGANFVIFSPAWLPKDCRVTTTTLRPEQPPGRPGNVKSGEYGLTPWTEANPSSLRTVIAGPNRQLRIKQFLYDWAVPAASTAPLWNSPQLNSFLCQDAVAWIGTDYMGNRGACIQLKRTQVEVSIQHGRFTDNELRDLLEGLKVADEELAAIVRQVPFHTLNYFVRHKVVGPDVPYGLWKYRPARRYSHSSRGGSADLTKAVNVPVPWLDQPDFMFDSAVSIEKPDENHRELEIVYRHRTNQSDHLWVVAMNQDSKIALPFPPQPDEHPAEVRRKENLRGRTVYYAALTDRYGAWEAWWQDQGTAFAVWGSASRYLESESFRRIVKQIGVR